MHDKGWINDDDPGATAPGWFRYCNLSSGDFNNDLTACNTPGEIWSCSFTGSGVSVVAPKEEGAGKIDIQIDNEINTTVDLSAVGSRRAQQIVYELTGLTSDKHTIKIVNRGPGPVSVDAVIAHEK
jgi:hypothetical protein